MTHPDKISPKLIKQVAREVAEFAYKTSSQPGSLPEAAPLDFATVPRIASTLTIWSLKSSALEKLAQTELEGDLSEWAQQTPLLHHQVEWSNRPAGFVRSQREPLYEKSVVQINISASESPLHRVLEAVTENKFDEEDFMASDPVMRLLEIPSYQITAIWLFDEPRRESRIKVSSAPKRYEGLRQNRLLDSSEFFNALRTGGPLRGVI